MKEARYIEGQGTNNVAYNPWHVLVSRLFAQLHDKTVEDLGRRPVTFNNLQDLVGCL